MMVCLAAAGCGETAPAAAGAVTAETAQEAETKQRKSTRGDAGLQGSADTDAAGSLQEQVSSAKEAVSWSDLTQTGSMELSHATQFAVDSYGDYRRIRIPEDGQDFLLVPEGEAVPQGLPEGMVVLQQPLDKTYLVSSSVMDYILRIGALEDVVLSGTKEEDWSLSEAQEAMDLGYIQYGGRYNQPDYELILAEGCNLAVENTMIYHNPEVKEKLESLGIPVLVERSSYEPDPLGRLEWIRLYGVLYDQEDVADTWYRNEAAELSKVMQEEPTGQTAAYFSVAANGAVTIRRPGDYVTRLIEMAGGTYIFTSQDANGDDTALSTLNIPMEQFYAQAKDADYLIYNSTIEGELSSVQDLLDKDALFGDFRAVQNGHVYAAGKNLFQEPTGMGEFVKELHAAFTGKDAGEGEYLTHLQ